MDWLYGLADVDEPGLLLPPENVVLGEVGVDEVTLRVELAHHLHHLVVGSLQLATGHPLGGLLQLRRRSALLAEEGHDQDVLLEDHHLRHSEK